LSHDRRIIAMHDSGSVNSMGIFSSIKDAIFGTESEPSKPQGTSTATAPPPAAMPNALNPAPT